MRPPCGRDCPKRCGGCQATCAEWAEWVKFRDAAYAKKTTAIEQYAAEKNSDKKKRFINYRHKLGR